MEHVASLAVARIERFLEQEPIVWLSTVRPDGTPHIVPIWFWWDGEALLVFSKPDAQKVRNLRARPSAMLALGDADEDFDIGLIEGRAEILDRPTAEVLPPAHLAKYADRMAAIGLTPAEYAATYSLVIRIVPARYLGWHGRTLPAERPPRRRPGQPHRRAAPRLGRGRGRAVHAEARTPRAGARRPAAGRATQPARLAGRPADPRLARAECRDAPTPERRRALIRSPEPAGPARTKARRTPAVSRRAARPRRARR